MKNKNFKVLTCLILLCIIFINSFLQCFAFDKENSNNVDLFVSKANNNIINSNSESTADEIGETTSFALDSVVVQMTNKASLELKDYSVYSQWLLDGDMDFDEVLSVTDATLLQKYLSGLVTFDKKQKLVADFNNDNIIDIKDATEIKKKLVGLSD